MYSGVHCEVQRRSYSTRCNSVRARLITDNLPERRRAFHAMMYELTPFDRSFSPPEVSCHYAHLCKSHRSTIENSPYSRTCQSTMTILFGLNVPIPSGSHKAAVTAFATFGPRFILFIAILPRVARLDSDPSDSPTLSSTSVTFQESMQAVSDFLPPPDIDLFEKYNHTFRIETSQP